MFSINGSKIEAVFGCTPSQAVDNVEFLAPLFGREKAESIVKSTGFVVRRAAPKGASVCDLALPAAKAALVGVDPETVGGIVFVTFSGDRRYPSCAQRMQGALNLPRSVAALDVQLACGGYPYGLYVASRLAEDSGKRVLLLDGDVQTAFLSPSDAATNAVMGDGASATLVAPRSKRGSWLLRRELRDLLDEDERWNFAFLTAGAKGGSLDCPAAGPVAMRGFDVFQFVMGEVASFLRNFVVEARAGAAKFVPHQANLYMIRQLTAAIGLSESQLLVSGDRFGNPGSASVAMTLASEAGSPSGSYLLAGFGAGLSAAAAHVTLDGACRRGIVTC